ncbi:hypothetical protein GOP47_0027330 [Adiantum capillus-veneris]|nr:hypothetical protein GOP47_0027330 [Adiantum capillus-veneris]
MFEGEWELLTIDAPGDFAWGERVDFDIVTEIDQVAGIVRQVGWREQACDLRREYAENHGADMTLNGQAEVADVPTHAL